MVDNDHFVGKADEVVENRKTLVSVIVPVYNVADYLDRCLESIVLQSKKEIEIILVDDGSTDGSGTLCDVWKKRDHRVSVYHTTNAGAAAARNVGLDVAVGDSLMFVDADDYLELTIIEKMYSTMQTYDASCCMCGYTPVDEQGCQYEKVAIHKMEQTTGMQAIKARYLNQKMEYNVVNPWGKLFKAALWKDIRFAPGMYYEDLEVMPYLLHRCNCMVVIPENGYFYYLRSGSASRCTGTDNKRYTDSVLIREKHASFYRMIGEKELVRVTIQALCELIITSACNEWIPPEAKIESMSQYRKYMKELLVSSEVGRKEKLRFLLFAVGGDKIYRIIAKHNTGKRM